MAAFLKLKSSSLRLTLLRHKRFCHTILEGDLEAEFFGELGPKLMGASENSQGNADISKWKKLDSRSLGITQSMIPYASKTVVKILQNEGYDAYLVGGCVRDLLLNRIPKDFDVITTANLKQIKKKFHHAIIVGRRFPICRVHIRGSEIEVSSFDTVGSHDGGKEEVCLSEMPEGYDEKDFMRWRNSLHRDFTVNSLFYDPFAHKIYDYSNGMADLTEMKLRTLVPAQSSFNVDSARILRGLRIAARLGLSFANDTEKAIHNLYASVKTLNKARLMMEMNSMLSYGAAQSSLLLLKRFNLLDILLPFQAAYLADQSEGQKPIMLMKLFFNLDSVVSSDHPCDAVLWVSLLGFHLALVNNPQDALVVWTLSCLLYYGTWEEGVKAARELSEEHVSFVPEIFDSLDNVEDEELAQRVSKFASIVLDSVKSLTDSKSLRKIMRLYSSSPAAGMAFISKNAGREGVKIFDVMVDNISSLEGKRHSYGIDYGLLREGDIPETRFVLGKVIMDTMQDGTSRYRTKLLSEKKDYIHMSKLKVKLGKPNSMNHKHEIQNCKSKAKRESDGPDTQLHQQRTKKQKQSQKGAAKEMLAMEKPKKFVAEDAKKPFPLLKEMPERDTRLETGEHCGVQNPKKMLKKLLQVLEYGSEMGKQYEAQPPEKLPNVAEKMSHILTQRQDQPPIDILNTLNLSNLFNEDKDPNKYSKPEKQPTKEEQSRDESNKKKRIPKLSGIFK